MSKPQYVTAVTIKPILKSESCHQLAQKSYQLPNKPQSPPLIKPHTNQLIKAKSTHYLPKEYESNIMSKDQLSQKRKTIEAYLTNNNENPNLNSKSNSSSVINRVKTVDKRVTQGQRQGRINNNLLVRSNTMPEFSELLDDSFENVEAAFEDLFMSSIITRKI